MYDIIVLSRYYPALCNGRIANIQHIYGYLNKYTSMSIKFNAKITVYDAFKTIK